MSAQEIPIDEIQVINRLRKVDTDKVQEIAQSISQIGQLHNIHVAKKGSKFVLLSGAHRCAAVKLLKKPTISAIVRENDELINKLVEVSENLANKPLNALEEAKFLLMREEILVKLGQKAVAGSNQYTKGSLTNTELAQQLGMSKRTYQYKKQVAQILPEVQELIGETRHANNLYDMVTLSQQPEHIQLEVGKILHSKGARTFKRALLIAKMKFIQSTWTKENEELRDEIQTPHSVMRFTRKEDRLNDICKMVSHDENLRKKRVSSDFGLNEIHNYSGLPEHSKFFIKYWSKEGDLVMDNSCGKGVNLLTGAYLKRRIIGYDLSKDNLDAIDNALSNVIGLDRSQFKLHHSCGIDLAEYKNEKDILDCCINDIPYPLGTEKYTDDPRDLCNVMDLEQYYDRVEVMLGNLYRLIKPSDYKQKIFKPIIMKCSSVRKGSQGIHSMDTDIELRARKVNLTLHDKIISEHRPTLNYLQKCINSRYTLKTHEIVLVFLKYQ